ncbi:MAG: protein kinase [Polyangiales bacterium]
MPGPSTDRFELLRLVGEGSYGVVYEARDRETDKSVAFKLLNRADEVAEERFEREASVLSELSHPAIVRYVAHGTTNHGQRYLVMEWLSGHTLDRLLRSRQPVRDVLAFARRVVAGLAYAEVRGVIHRDLKPANLFLVDGAPSAAKIVDFGLARRSSDRHNLTQTGFVVGTPLYMSPEQSRGDSDIGARTDVFSLGSVLYHCLTGEEPFLASQPLAILSKIVFEEPHPLEQVAPHVPSALRELVHGMLRKKPEQRPAMREIAQQLAAIADELGSQELRGVADSATSEVLLPLYPKGGAATLSRRRHSLEMRVQSAVFVRELSMLPAPLETALHATAARHGARAERLHDGSCVFASAQRLGVTEHAVASARCALALHQLLGEHARLAVCLGRATVGDALPAGELYERGAALLASTPDGALRIDDACAALLDARFEITGTGDARTLVRERTGGDAPRTVLGQVTTFVGRDRELSQLQLSFDECVEESVARVVLVTAPAGAGKSRLLHELLERLRRGGTRFTLLSARGDAMRAGTQFGLLAPALQGWAGLAGSDAIDIKRGKLRARLASVVPAPRVEELAHFLGEMIGVPFPHDASPQLRAARTDHQLMADRTLSSWLEWMEAISKQPVLFCVEDLHWADPASLRYLEAALRNAQERALMVLALARPEVRASFPNLFAERELTEIRLPKLGAKACARLLDALSAEGLTPTLRDLIIQRADGNPFFIEELLRALQSARQDESLPQSILAIVQARLDALGDESKQLVRAASVFGLSFRLDGVRALFDADETRLDLEGGLAMLCEREVIFARGPAGEQEFEFRHALIRDAAYELLPDEERELAHRLAASWLEEQGEAPALLAHHYERGAARELAAQWYARAAEQAFESGSLDDVARCGERAIACGVSGEALGKVAALLAEARSYSEDDAGAADWAEQARALLVPAHPAWWRATQVGAVAYLRMGRAELDLFASDMIASFDTSSTQSEQALAVAYLISESLRLTRDDLAARLLALIRAASPESVRGRAEGCLGSALAMQAFFARNTSQALRHAQGALEAQRRAGALRDVADTAGLAGYIAHELGRYDDAERELTEQVQLGRRLGSQRDVLYGQLMLGSVFLRKNALASAETCLREALQGYRSTGVDSYQAEAHAYLAGVLEQRGELEAAQRELDSARELKQVEPGAASYVLARASSLASRRGERERALALASEALTISRQDGVYELVGWVRLRHVESLIDAGQHDAARAALADARAWLDAQAAKIDEDEARASFLNHVAEHAGLRALSL